MRNRKQEIKWHPGYDGEYGHPVFDENAPEKQKQVHDKPAKPIQRGLGDY